MSIKLVLAALASAALWVGMVETTAAQGGGAAQGGDAAQGGATQGEAAKGDTAQGGSAQGGGGAAKGGDEEAPVDAEGLPTYLVKDGKVDRGTYNGYRRYHSSCHTCHGPDGLGSSFAPNLTESLKVLDYYQFADVVTNGRQRMGATGDKVMPSFGLDPNVMMHLDDIYRYLKARSDGAIGRGRPERFKS